MDGADAYQSKTGLETLVSWVEEAEEVSEPARKLSERDRDYYDHKQLTSEEKAELSKRGQPSVIINRIHPKVNYLLGFEASNRTDPKAFPRTPQDEDAAAAATDALRYLKDKTELDQTLSSVWENLLIEGYGGHELTVEQRETGETEFVIVHWPWDRLFYDPHSRKHDFSDARYLGGYVWMDADEAKTQWPHAEEAIEHTLSAATTTVTYDDRPAWKTWVSGKARKRVRIVQMYHREAGQWWYCVFTKGGKIDSYPVPFQDQNGQSWCPLLLQSAFVDRDNNRYGLVRVLVDIQDEINKRRSKALHRLTMRQALMEEGAVRDVDAMREQLAKPDGIVVINPGFRFELLNTSEQLSAELTMLQESKSEIEELGPNAAMLGRDDDAPSGRAILANQQSGQTEITALLDRHRFLKKRTYQRLWDLVRQYKTEEWWVRVTDREDNVRFVGLNRKVTMAEELLKRIESQGAPPEEAQQILTQMASDPTQAQQLQQVVRIENNPTEMYMDISIEEVKDTANVQEEQFQALVALAPAVTFPPTVYLKASGLRNKEELLQELEGQQGNPEIDEIKLTGAKLELEKLAAEIEKTKAETIKTKVEADVALLPVGQVQDPTVQPSPDQQMRESVPPPGLAGDGLMPPPG